MQAVTVVHYLPDTAGLNGVLPFQGLPTKWFTYIFITIAAVSFRRTTTRYQCKFPINICWIQTLLRTFLWFSSFVLKSLSGQNHIPIHPGNRNSRKHPCSYIIHHPPYEDDTKIPFVATLWLTRPVRRSVSMTTTASASIRRVPRAWPGFRLYFYSLIGLVDRADNTESLTGQASSARSLFPLIIESGVIACQ